MRGRRRQLRRPRPRASQPPRRECGDRGGVALQLDRRQRDEPHEGLAGQRLAHRRADEDAVGRRGGAEPRGEVDDGAEHGEVQPRRARRSRPCTTSPAAMPRPTCRFHSGCASSRSARACWISRPQATALRSMPAPWNTRHDLVADELVDVAAVALDDRGLRVEVLVEHLDHDLGRDGLGEGGVAADVGEEHRGAAPLAAAGDAARRSAAATAVIGAARDELHQLEPLAELADHRVHPAGEVADLVAGPHPLDPRGQVAGADPGGDLADLQDRAGEPAGEERARPPRRRRSRRGRRAAGCAACG